MVITDIKRSKKGNVLIFADNEYLTSLPPEVFLKSGLKKGGYIDEEIMQTILADSNKHKAKQKALELLTFRAHSKKELENKITRTVGESAAQEAVEKMEELGLVNDLEFAKSYSLELAQRKYYSAKRIEFELIQKGIEKDIIDKVFEDIYIDEEQNINAALSKKHLSMPLDEKTKRRTIAWLQRLGYGLGQIISAIDNLN